MCSVNLVEAYDAANVFFFYSKLLATDYIFHIPMIDLYIFVIMQNFDFLLFFNLHSNALPAGLLLSIKYNDCNMLE